MCNEEFGLVLKVPWSSLYLSIESSLVVVSIHFHNIHDVCSAL